MGVVFRAEDIRLGRDVALKFLPDHLISDRVALERFRREARAASHISHPHICTVYDADEDAGQPFLVMELLQGETLKHRLNRGRVPPAELVEWSSQIADALNAAHNAGIVHRDIKPANLFITTRGQIKVLDFGLASVTLPAAFARRSGDDTETLVDLETKPGQTIGTIAYMSPEQARGDELDGRTDIFSLGIVMYEMATAESPFTGSTTAVIFDGVLNREPQPVLDRNSTLPAELGRIIGKTLEKDRRLRYQSAAELYADLQRLKRDSSAGRVSGALPGAQRTRRSSRVWLAAVVSGLLLFASAAFFLSRRHRALPVRELVPTRVTSNSSEAPIQKIALSPDGKYLAYSDVNGVHVRSLQTGDSRLMPDSKGMGVWWWASDATQFFVIKRKAAQMMVYSMSLAGGIPHLLGDAMPSPEGRYMINWADEHLEVRAKAGGKPLSIDRKDASRSAFACSPDDKRLAVVFSQEEGQRFWIEAIDLENGRRTTMIKPQPEPIGDISWSSESELIYTRYEQAPRTDTNLWAVRIDPSTGRPLGAPSPRTHWNDFQIEAVSSDADLRHVCVLRKSVASDIYVGDLQPHVSRLGVLHQLTSEDSENQPFAWTPDGKKLLFLSNRDGYRRLYKQDIQTDTAELVTPGPVSLDNCRVSPDGKWLLYVNVDLSKMRLMRMPLEGGAPQEVLTSAAVSGFSCSRIPGGACILSETRGPADVISLIDFMKGRGPEIFEKGGDTSAPTISPDGRHIAFVLAGAPRNRIRVTNLHGRTENEITVTDAEYLISLDWAADGTGLFSGDLQPTGSRLLHIEPNGAAQPLLTQTTRARIWGISSPDGWHLATFKTKVSANVWMVENP